MRPVIVLISMAGLVGEGTQFDSSSKSFRFGFPGGEGGDGSGLLSGLSGSCGIGIGISYLEKGEWSSLLDSNQRLTNYGSATLTTELREGGRTD